MNNLHCGNENCKIDHRFNEKCLGCGVTRKNDNGTWVCDKCLETNKKQNG